MQLIPGVPLSPKLFSRESILAHPSVICHLIETGKNMPVQLCQSTDTKQNTEMQQIPASNITATSLSCPQRALIFPLPHWISTIILLDFNFLMDVAYRKAADMEI
ncbi:hypothetical protein HPG69_001498 [Diceros bicornis minor]|uniref:Uncharacterized protein n=1 Tax=Diceros bicornis minor TaxID=77932 RepID=A0A7J7FFV8_DICBM|nr:hypothetical protein HPG69_001498 [Diceros bicornis minor]